MRSVRFPARAWAALLVLGLLAAFPAAAQIPDEFTALKVLPKDIGQRELIAVMRSYAGALGVRCKHCHVGESEESLEGYDFASDEPETKRVARGMMKMTRTINDSLLPATGRKSPLEVGCKTCHRGVTRPQSLDDLLLAAVAENGVAAATEEYAELKQEYYGRGAYDFGAATLNGVAETLASEQRDVEGAIVLVRLNLEAHPDDAYSHLMLGQLLMTKGDSAAAIESVERALELEPENRWARQMLERMKGAEEKP